MTPPIDPDIYELREQIALHRADRAKLEAILQRLRGLEANGTDQLRTVVNNHLDVLAQQDAERGLKWVSQMSVPELEQYFEKYRNHRPRLLNFSKDLNEIATPGAREIRDRAARIVETLQGPPH
jgi:hypothetical protein